MNLFSFTVLVVTVSACAQAIDVPATNRLSNDRLADIRPRPEVLPGGDCTVNICFIFGGGPSLTATELSAQKNFSVDLVSVIGTDNAPNVAATQYGTDVMENQMLTSDVQSFSEKLLLPAEPPTSENRSALSAFMYCSSQLLPRGGDEVKKIVFFGRGGPVIRSRPIRFADFFRSEGGEVCAVGTGSANNDKLLAIAGGDPDKVLDVDNVLDVFKLAEIIDDLAADTCKVDV